MGKILLWVIVIVGGLLLTRILSHHNAKPQMRRTPKRAKTQAKIQDAEAMVRCAHCQIHLPRSEALLSGGKTWCCNDHAKLGPKV